MLGDIFFIYVIMYAAIFVSTLLIFGQEEYHNCLTFSLLWPISIPWFIYEVYKIFRFNYKMTHPAK